MSKSLKIILVVGGVGVVIGLTSWFYAPEKNGNSPTGSTNQNAPINYTTATQVKATNGLLPEGFPTTVPVEGTIGQVSKFAFGNGFQYTVNSTSSKTRDVLWTEYHDYMVSAGYSLQYGTDKTKGTVIGKRGTESMLVVITVKNKVSYILLTLVVH